MDAAQDYEERLRWWRVHCIGVVSLVPLAIVCVFVKHHAMAIPIGFEIAVASYAAVKAGRSLLATRDRTRESETIGDGVEDAHADDGGASSVIGIFIGLGLAGWGVYELARTFV